MQARGDLIEAALLALLLSAPRFFTTALVQAHDRLMLHRGLAVTGAGVVDGA